MAVERVGTPMALDRTVRDEEEPDPSGRRYVVTCDDCRFEEEVRGVEPAEATAMNHKRSTDHEVLALEVPETT